MHATLAQGCRQIEPVIDLNEYEQLENSIEICRETADGSR